MRALPAPASLLRRLRGGAGAPIRRRRLRSKRPVADLRSLLATASAALTVLAGLLLIAGSELEAAAGFAAAQTIGLTWLFVESYDKDRGWATAGCITAAGWTLIFCIPAWIYVADPDLLPATRSSQAIAIVTASLFGTVGALLTVQRLRTRPTTTRRVQVEPSVLIRDRLLACIAAGIAGFIVLLAVNGGPIEWIGNLDSTGEMTKGLTYVIFVALAVKFAAVVAICHRWASGGGLDLKLVGLLAMALLIVSLLGARAFLAFTFAELLLFYVLVKRPISLKIVLPAAAAIAAVVIFSLGTVKRYQYFSATSPSADTGFFDYVTGRAVRELPAAYANNYADGLRHVATAEELVPRRADYEYGKALLRLAVQPIPRAVRPTVSTEPALKRAFEPPGGNQYAIPLQTVGYIQLGIAGAILAGIVVGLAIAQLDRWLLRRRAALPALLALVAAAVQVPFVLRTGLPRGLAFSVLEVIGLWAVARITLERDAGGEPQPKTSQ